MITRRSLAALAAISPFAALLPACTEPTSGVGTGARRSLAEVRLGTPVDAAAVAAALLAQIDPGEVVCSPHSLRLAFLLAYAGAAGQTAEQASHTRQFSSC